MPYFTTAALIPMLIALIPLLRLATALAPAIFIIVYVYRKDSVEKEPRPLVIKLILAGVLSCLPAILLERLGSSILNNADISDPVIRDIIYYFAVIALVEELCKYFFLRRITWENENFNCSFDGIIYSVCVSLGFAMLENIIYVFGYGGFSFRTALIRAVSAIPGHAAFGVFMGLFYSLEKKNENRGRSFLASICNLFSLIFPIAIHGLYDFTASQGSMIIFVGVVAVMFLSAFGLISKTSENDREI